MDNSPGKMLDLRSATDTMSSKYRLSEFQEEKIKSYQQLEHFYMPYLRKAYEENQRILPNLKPPDELIVVSRQLEMKENDMRRKIETLHKDNQAKESRARDLANRVVYLLGRLKAYEPNFLDGDVPYQQDRQAILKRQEKLFNIKRDEIFFSLKIRGIDLLQEFGLSKQETDGIITLKDDKQLFEFILNKLKMRIKDYRSKEKESSEESYKEKVQLLRLNERIQFLTEANQLLKNNERRLKDKVEEIKLEWTNACNRLLAKQRQLEEKDSMIFQLKRILEEKENAALMASNRVAETTSLLDKQRQDLQDQLRNMRLLLTMYNTEKAQLQATIDEKQSQIEENRIRDKFNQQQYEKVFRQSTRWKERCEWIEKEKDNKFKILQKQYLRLGDQHKKLKEETESNKNRLHELRAENEQLRMFNERGIDEIGRKDSQVRQVTYRAVEMDKMMKNKLAAMEEQYMSRASTAEIIRDNQIKEAIRLKQEEFRHKWQASDREWSMKMQELQKNFDNKLNLQREAHARALSELQKVQKDYRDLLEFKKATVRQRSAAKSYLINVGQPIRSPSGANHIVIPNSYGGTVLSAPTQMISQPYESRESSKNQSTLAPLQSSMTEKDKK